LGGLAPAKKQAKPLPIDQARSISICTNNRRTIRCANEI
jgi:hypothetical protein